MTIAEIMRQVQSTACLLSNPGCLPDREARHKAASELARLIEQVDAAPTKSLAPAEDLALAIRRFNQAIGNSVKVEITINP